LKLFANTKSPTSSNEDVGLSLAAIAAKN